MSVLSLMRGHLSVKFFRARRRGVATSLPVMIDFFDNKTVNFAFYIQETRKHNRQHSKIFTGQLSCPVEF